MFNLAWPWAFLLVPLPLMLHLLLPARPRAGSALQVPFFRQLASLGRHKPRLRSRIKAHLLLPGLVWLLLVCATTRPQWLEAQRLLDPDSRSSMLAMDLSASMRTKDLGDNNPNRLEVTRTLLLQLLEQQPDDRFGLIFFATQAYLQTPLTFDHDSLRHWLHTAEPGIAGDNTAIGDAIGLAIKQLRNLPAHEKNLVLLTDGANNSGIMPPRTAARFAAAEGIRIHALGIGQAASNSQGGPDQGLLQEIAWQTGGRYLHVNSTASLENAISFIHGLPAANTQTREHWQIQELYRWPLATALALGLLHAAGQLLRLAVRLRGTGAQP